MEKRLPTPTSGVIYRPVNGGAVLLSVNAEIYFGLNAVGAFIWEHLPPACRTLDELTATVAAAYPDASQDTIRTDIRALLDDLAANGLIQQRTGDEDARNVSLAGEAPQTAASRLA